MSDDPLHRAEELYAASRLGEALALARGVVSARPRDPRALVLLGLIMARNGQADDALTWLERARDSDPGAAAAWQGLGLVYRQLGRVADSIVAYERALTIEPDDPATHVNLAAALRTVGDLTRAVSHLERALTLAPRLRAASFNLGNCLFDLRDFDRAGAAYLACLRLDPRDAEAALGVARVFREQRRYDMAEKTLQAAARLRPEDRDLQAGLGALWHDMGRSGDARDILQRVLAAQPDHPQALTYLANVERDTGDVERAEALYRRALTAHPDDTEAMFSLAAVLFGRGQRREAVALIDRIRELHPHDADIRYRCGMALLGEGEFPPGWADYAWRVKTVRHRAVRFSHLPQLEAPRFDGRKVVLWGEQGLGDEILYAGFLTDLRAHAANLVCEVDPRLVALLRRGLPEFRFVGRSFMPALPGAVSDEAARETWRAARLDPAFGGATHQIALPDLGGWLRPDFARFPAHGGYLRADPARSAAFAGWLARRPGERVVGLSWISRNPDLLRYKSLDLRTLVDALPRDGVRLVNLQYGDVTAEIAELERATGRRVEVAPDLDCFADIDSLAALVMACDAVITVSTVTVHLAGALGAPTALLCPWAHGKPWYWFQSRADSPWYPSVRLFRQAPDGSWAFSLVAAARWAAERVID